MYVSVPDNESWTPSSHIVTTIGAAPVLTSQSPVSNLNLNRSKWWSDLMDDTESVFDDTGWRSDLIGRSIKCNKLYIWRRFDFMFLFSAARHYETTTLEFTELKSPAGRTRLRMIINEETNFKRHQIQKNKTEIVSWPTSSGVQLTPCFSLWAENQTLICSSLNFVCEDKPMISDTEGYGNLRAKKKKKSEFDWGHKWNNTVSADQFIVEDFQMQSF